MRSYRTPPNRERKWPARPRLLVAVSGWMMLVPVTASCAYQEVRLRAELDGHRGLVTAIAIGPDDEYLISGGFDNTVRVWNLATGTPRGVLEGHLGPVWSVRFLEGGETIASSEESSHVQTTLEAGKTRLWGTGTGAVLEITDWPSLVLTPDGTTLAYAQGGTVRLRDMASGEDWQTLQRTVRYGSDVWGFTKDGRTLVATSYLHEIVLWNVQTGRERIVLPDENVLSVALAPDERVLAAGPGGGGGPVRIWDLEQGTLIAELDGHTARVWDVEFSPDGRLLASAGWDGAVRIWDVSTGDLVALLTGLNRFYSVAFSSDGGTLVAGGGHGELPADLSGRILIWELDSTR